MASNEHSGEGNRGSDRKEVPENSAASSGNSGQRGESTRMRNDEKTAGRLGGGVKGNPAGTGNRSGEQGNASQQSDADTDGGAPSRQTSTASEESGQL